MLAATLLPGLLTTGGAPKHRAERTKIRLSHQKVRKRGWWVHAALSPHVQSVAVHPPFRS